MARFPMIYIRDINGANVLMYVRLEEDSYFGGKVHPDVEFEHGPHVWHTLTSMLGLIAMIANCGTRYPYWLDSSESYSIEIGRRMKADELARALGCDVEKILKYFRLSVEMETVDA